MSKRVPLLIALIAELGLIGWLYSLYPSHVEQDILMVQGQVQSRYADLHADWLKLSGGIVLIMILLCCTVYLLVKNWRTR